MRLRLMLPLALFALLAACSGDDSDPKGPNSTPESTAPPGHVTTPGAPITAQALGLRTQAVKWVDAEAYNPRTIVESTEPVWSNDPRLASQPAANQAWSAFVLRPDSPPQPLYNTTKRWLRDLTWDRDGIAVEFATRRVVTLTGSGDKATLEWQGRVVVDPSTGVVREEFDVLPMTGGNDGPGRQLDDRSKTVLVQRDAAGTQVVLTIGTGYGPFRRIDTVYVLDKQGNTKRLEGIKDLRSFGWLPGGGALHAYAAPQAGQPFRPTNETYIIPTSDGQAIYIGELPFRAEGLYGTTAANGSRMLILVPDPASTTAGAGLMLIYDTRKHDLRVLGKGPAVLLPNPAGFPPQVPITWPDGSNELAIGAGADAVIVNATTGAMRPGQAQELLQTSPPATRSPGGRYGASVVPTLPQPPGVECSGGPSGVTITDAQTGERRTLLECATGTGGTLTWVDDHMLAVTIYSCKGCEPKAAGLTLLDVTSGRTIPLMQGLEIGTSVTPSPDGRSILVAGRGLRLYGRNGALQRDFGLAPDGLTHTSPAWAPDSRSFAYILGPA